MSAHFDCPLTHTAWSGLVGVAKGSWLPVESYSSPTSTGARSLPPPLVDEKKSGAAAASATTFALVDEEEDEDDDDEEEEADDDEAREGVALPAGGLSTLQRAAGV